MLASITPLGERSRRQRWPVTVASLVLGATAGGALAGSIAGLVGGTLPLSGDARLGVLAAAAAVGALLDLGPARLRTPTHRRQVDERWLHRYRGFVYGAGFGAQLGVGLATIVTTSAVYVTVLAALLAPGAAAGALVGGVFGLGRGATVLAAARVDTPPRLLAFHRRFRDAEPFAQAAVVAAQAAVVVAGLLVVR